VQEVGLKVLTNCLEKHQTFVIKPEPVLKSQHFSETETFAKTDIKT